MDLGCTLDLFQIIDYRLRLWARTCALHAISAVAELFVLFSLYFVVAK